MNYLQQDNLINIKDINLSNFRSLDSSAKHLLVDDKLFDKYLINNDSTLVSINNGYLNLNSYSSLKHNIKSLNLDRSNLKYKIIGLFKYYDEQSKTTSIRYILNFFDSKNNITISFIQFDNNWKLEFVEIRNRK